MERQLLILILSILSFSLYALGLGEIKLHSYLNEPFLADISLIDAESVSPSNMKVSLASFDEYTKLALPHDPVLSDMQLSIKRSTSGRPIIRVQSETRIQTPYLVLLVNLTWPHGEIFHTYTILLDPPHYGMKTKPNAVSHPFSHRTYSNERESQETPSVQEESTYASYGPTLVNENIWQIAKRYKLNNLTLPQIVLGIVGNNPEAFEAGNLNGLKPASLLNIPNSTELSKISKNLAAQEVEAHDIAWRTHTPIHHVLPPPYLPTEYHDTTLASAVPSFNPLSVDSKIPASPLLSSKQPSSEAQLSLETKLKTLEETNLQLIQTLQKREQENQHLRTEIAFLKQQILSLKGLRPAPHTHVLYLWLDLLMLLGVIAGMGWWYWRKNQQIIKPEPEAPPSDTLLPDAPLPETPPPSQPPPETPLKNPKALQMLLDVAKTYLKKGETQAAKQALEEVAQYGDENQKKEALELISKIP